MGIPVSITLLVVLIYSLVIFILSCGLGRWTRLSATGSVKQEEVTVIVPFRNEEKQLPALVNDLRDQTYPEKLVEIIFVNDHSRDNSKFVLSELIGANTHMICLDLPQGRFGKKAAIAYAVQHAKGDWIIQTDADCSVGSQFISSHMAFRERHNPDMVAGIVSTSKGAGGFLQIIERLDLLGLVGAGAGSFHFKRAVMCNGANLAYSKELYEKSRQFDPSGGVASGDDMFLMIGARKLGKALAFMANPEALVETLPVTTLRGFIAQRIRWGSKTIHYKMIDIQLLAILVALTNILVLLIPLFLLLNSEFRIWLMLAFLIKTLADFTLLFRITNHIGRQRNLWYFLPVSLIYYGLQIVILSGSLFNRNIWKGRSY